MDSKLFTQAIVKFLAGVVLVGALLFLPAWTLNYPNAYLFMALLFVPMFIMGVVLFIKSPNLLDRLGLSPIIRENLRRI